jgi:hypothetical protein
MSLLQKTLDSIEAEADKKSAIAVAHAGTIHELETLTGILSGLGAGELRPVVTFHERTEDIHSAMAIDVRILVFQDQAATLRAVDKSGRSHTLEIGKGYDGRPETTVRFEGLSSYITIIDYVHAMEQAA